MEEESELESELENNISNRKQRQPMKKQDYVYYNSDESDPDELPIPPSFPKKKVEKKLTILKPIQESHHRSVLAQTSSYVQADSQHEPHLTFRFPKNTVINQPTQEDQPQPNCHLEIDAQSSSEGSLIKCSCEKNTSKYL